MIPLIVFLLSLGISSCILAMIFGTLIQGIIGIVALIAAVVTIRLKSSPLRGE